jgi:hypothetical protein
MIRFIARQWQMTAIALLLTTGRGEIFYNRCQAAEGNWLSGEALQDALAKKVGVAWSNIPLRRALESLSNSQRVAVMLDRRVDPDQKIELAFDNVSLQEALQRIALRLDVGMTVIGPVIYFGPKATAERLRTVAALSNDDARRLAPDTRTKWMQAKPWKWEKLAAPRDLVSTLGNENGLKIAGLEQIPGDLWGAANLPPLSLADRLSLVLAQFDLTFEIGADGTSVRLVPMPSKPVVERTYSVSGVAQDVVSQLRQNKLLSGAEIGLNGGKLVVRGRQEDQDVVRDLLAGGTARRSSVTEGKKVYTLRVELPISKLLEALGPKLGIEIEINKPAIAAAGISLETKVKVDVKEVSADELLKAVLDPVGLTFAHHDNVVEVKPK